MLYQTLAKYMSSNDIGYHTPQLRAAEIDARLPHSAFHAIIPWFITTMARCTFYTFTFASLSFAWIHAVDLPQSCLHFEYAVYSIMTRAYIKMQLAWLGKKLIHRTKESEEADR